MPNMKEPGWGSARENWFGLRDCCDCDEGDDG